MVVAAVIISVDKSVAVSSRSERNSAQNFAEARGPDGRKALTRGSAGCCQIIGDHNQLVRVGALIAVSADGRGDGPDRRGAIAIDATDDVAKAIGSTQKECANYFVNAGYASTRADHALEFV